MVLENQHYLILYLKKPGYDIKDGSIKFEDTDILEISPDERAALGIYMAFQYPVEIQELLIHLLRTAINSIKKT